MAARAASGGADLAAAHASPPRHTPTRSISRSSRPPVTSSTATAVASPSSAYNHASPDTSQHRPRRTPSGSRYKTDSTAHHEYESARVTRQPSHRSSSRDQPPPPSSSSRDARQPRRSTSRSSANHSHRSAEMAPSATASGHAEGASSSGTKSRSRTTVPTQSGKWLLGKTIGEGSMGKVKLARKEDGSEQVIRQLLYPYTFVFANALISRLPVKSSLVDRPKTTRREQIKNEPTSPRRFEPPAKLPS